MVLSPAATPRSDVMDHREATALREAALAERLAAYLKDLGAPRNEVRRCISRLRETALRPYGYDYYYLNLLTALGHLLAPPYVATLAAAAVRHKLWSGWDFCNRVVAFLEGRASEWDSRLPSWDLEPVHASLQRGRGVLAVTVHFGMFRDIAARLTAAGFHVALGVDNDSAGKLRSLLSRGATYQPQDPFSFGRGTIRIIDMEQDALASLRLMTALKRNEVAVVLADGNSGLDGPRGISNRQVITFLGQTVRVKTGFLSIAAATGSPVIPLVASERVRGTIEYDEHFPTGLTSTSAARALVQRVYAFFESHVLHAPSAWEGAGRLHRWRPAPSGSVMIPSDPDRARESLRRAARLTLNGTRAAVIHQGECVALVDAPTLAAFRVTEGMPLLEPLVCRGRLSARAWRTTAHGLDPKILAILGSWLRLGVAHEEGTDRSGTRVAVVPRKVLA